MALSMYISNRQITPSTLYLVSNSNLKIKCFVLFSYYYRDYVLFVGSSLTFDSKNASTNKNDENLAVIRTASYSLGRPPAFLHYLSVCAKLVFAFHDYFLIIVSRKWKAPSQSSCNDVDEDDDIYEDNDDEEDEADDDISQWKKLSRHTKKRTTWNQNG